MLLECSKRACCSLIASIFPWKPLYGPGAEWGSPNYLQQRFEYVPQPVYVGQRPNVYLTEPMMNSNSLASCAPQISPQSAGNVWSYCPSKKTSLSRRQSVSWWVSTSFAAPPHKTELYSWITIESKVSSTKRLCKKASDISSIFDLIKTSSSRLLILPVEISNKDGSPFIKKACTKSSSLLIRIDLGRLQIQLTLYLMLDFFW